MADGFDRDHPLFEGSLIVRVVGSGRGKDGERPMTLRVLQTASAPSGTRSVRLEIADESDPFFLRTLDVDETEFAELKHEQRLMVDFADFPAHLVSLLGHVRRPAATRSQAADGGEADDDASSVHSRDGAASTGKHRGDHVSHEAMALLRPAPHGRVFMATLHDASSAASPAASASARHSHSHSYPHSHSHSSSAPSSSASSASSGGAARRLPSFEVVERTAFRDLVHLDVPVAPGGDAAVKAVLASRLELEQARHAAAARELRGTAQALQQTSARLAKLERESAADRAGAEARCRETDARAAAELAGVREDAARREAALAARMQEQAAGDRSRAEEAQGSLRAELRSVGDRAQSLDRALEATRQELEAARRGAGEAERRAAGAAQEAERATARAEAAEARSRKLVATESQLRERCAALAQAAEDRQALAERADETCRAVEQSRAASDQALGILQESVESLTKKLREAFGRIDQANELTSRLDRELKQATEARDRAEQTRRDAMDREAEAGRAVAAARADAEAAQTAAEAERQARSKAEAAAAASERETLAQREAAAKHARVIEYLNTELSELRLGTTGRAAMAATRGRHNPKEFGADLSDVSIGGVARAAGAPAMAAANPYLKPDWRSASASAPSAYLA